MSQHLEHRRRGAAVQDGRHRAHTAQTGGAQVAQSQPVVGAVGGGPRQAEAEDVGRGHQTPAADGTGPERGREAGRRLVVPLAVAHEERLEAKRRHIEHAETPEAVHLSGKSDCRYPSSLAVQLTKKKSLSPPSPDHTSKRDDDEKNNNNEKKKNVIPHT